MPAQGMAMTEGVLVRWLKQPGDWVARGEPLAEIETDKSNVELESPVEGRLDGLLVEAGATVRVGAPIARILDTVEEDGAAPPAAPATTPPPPETSQSNIPRPAVPTPPRRSTRGAPVIAAPSIHERSTEAPAEVAGELLSLDLAGLPSEDLVEWLSTMLLIREFEDASNRLAFAGKIPGGIHSAAGQEAVAVGVVRALAPTDIVTSTHRSHHHSLAKGLDPGAIMAELYGKATGLLRGRAGHMHLADFSKGLFGSNGIVGGGLGIAMGAALAAQMKDVDQVAVGFFGDGGANTGRVWEFVNLASVWKLPLIVVCENNLYAVETHIERASACDSVAHRAAGFGLPTRTVDGQDVGAMYAATKEARERAANGGGPTFIEAQTYRYEGHNTGDVGNYRTAGEVERWRRTKDPILRLSRAMQSEGLLAEEQYDRLLEAARATVAEATDFAERAPWPDPSIALENVTGLQTKVRGNV
jgi:pyruvate dehydrogenase E1 component alpha subunit